MSSLWQSKKK